MFELNRMMNLPKLCFGTWVFSGKTWGGINEFHAIEALEFAIDQGLNFIDTAPIYGHGLSEKIVGQVVKSCRNQVILATKCGLRLEGSQVIHDLSPDSIRSEIQASLTRLQTDYIDLYQLHHVDPKVPLEQSVETLCGLKSQGKIKAIGISNHPVELVERALKVEPNLATTQNQYSLLDRSIEKDILPFCQKNNIGALAYGAMAGGILTGKYDKPPRLTQADARSFFYDCYRGEKFQQVSKFVDELRFFGRPLNEIVINWVRQQSGVQSVLVGCRNVKQVKANLKALTWTLTQEELKKIKTIAGNI